MALAGASLWKTRLLRFALGASAPVTGAALGVLRNKWLAVHLQSAGLGVLGQVNSGQVWLGTLTSLGLGLPVARAVGAASAAGDDESIRRTVSTSAALVALVALPVVLLGVALAPWISAALLGSPEHAVLVRISMVGVVGLAFQNLLQGWFAGRSDLVGSLALAAGGGALALAATLLLVPRLGLTGGAIGTAALFPTGVAAALWVRRRRYAPFLTRRSGSLFEPERARRLVTIAAAALSLAIVEQGTLLAARAHFLRVHGVAANGLFQAAIALSQQIGAPFYTYLASYAFGRISGAPGPSGIRDYTRKQWVPLVLGAAGAFAAAMVVSTPLLRLFYSNRFDAARPMMAYLLFGEFCKVGVQVWALGALPLKGPRLWVPIGLSYSAALAVAYPVLSRLAPGPSSLALAGAVAGAFSLGFCGVLMSRAGVSLSGRDLAMVAAALAGLALLARALAT